LLETHLVANEDKYERTPGSCASAVWRIFAPLILEPREKPIRREFRLVAARAAGDRRANGVGDEHGPVRDEAVRRDP
jgi:hypothetical protein